MSSTHPEALPRPGIGRPARMWAVVMAVVVGLLLSSAPSAFASTRSDQLAAANRLSTENLLAFGAEVTNHRAELIGLGLNLDTDGCSTPNIPQLAALEAQFNALFYEACVRHDFGYRNFGGTGLRLDPTEARRATLDKQLFTDMRLICSKVPAANRAECVVIAGIYYVGVRLFGRPSFLGTASTDAAVAKKS